MISNIGPIGLILIVATILILFGPKKLPELGKAAGKTLQAFRQSMSEKKKED